MFVIGLPHLSTEPGLDLLRLLLLPDTFWNIVFVTGLPLRVRKPFSKSYSLSSLSPSRAFESNTSQYITPIGIIRVDVGSDYHGTRPSPSPSNNSTTKSTNSPSESTSPPPAPPSSPVVQYYNASTVEDVVEIETGYTNGNEWLKWVHFTAHSQNLTNGIVCSQPRPTLTTTQAPLLIDSDRPGFDCMYGLHMRASPTNCSTLSHLFRPAPNNTLPPIFTPVKGNYTCLTKQGDSSHREVGSMPSSWCSRTINVTDWHNATQLEWARSDLFWYCGGKCLRNRPPSNW